MNREGGCLCGAVEYSFNSDAVISASHCHCTDCRKSTGSGKATIIMIQDSSLVINGEIKSKSKARIIRDGVVVYNGEIQSIYREKNQVKEVGTGLECGISIKDFIDFKEKDVIESYQADKIQRSI